MKEIGCFDVLEAKAEWSGAELVGEVISTKLIVKGFVLMSNSSCPKREGRTEERIQASHLKPQRYLGLDTGTGSWIIRLFRLRTLKHPDVLVYYLV